MYNAKPGRPSRTYLRRGRCFASARRQTSRQTAAYPSPPVPGHNVGRAFTPAAAALRHRTANRQSPPAQEHPSTSRPPSPQPQASKASPARGGAAAGGGGVPHLALPIPFRLAAHAPPPPNLAANCRLSVAARSRPQCRAGVHARRSSLASPHRAANRRLRRFTICPRRTSLFPAIPASAAPPPPAASGGGVPHRAPPIPSRLAAHAPLPHICVGADALHRPAARPSSKLSLTRRCPFPATM